MTTRVKHSIIIISCALTVLVFGSIIALMDAWLGQSNGWAKGGIEAALSIAGFAAMIKVGEKTEEVLDKWGW